MSLTTKATTAILTGLFFGGTVWLWQMMGEDVFVTRVMAMATSCL
ncbi:MAG: hypothetical protein AAGA76_05785 [Pseudomonadota bacterium]